MSATAVTYRGIDDAWPTIVREFDSQYEVNCDDRNEEGLSRAEQLHRSIKDLHRRGNRVRSELIAALRALHEGNQFFDLGYSSFGQYCERELGIARSTGYEWIKTGSLLDRLPGTRALHSEGDLSWEQTREIAKVATPEHEKEWAQFAVDHSVRQLRAEVKDALAEGRKQPRAREHGLPNVRSKLVLDLTREQQERFEAALRIARENASQGDESDPGPGGDSLVDALMQLVDQVLSGQLLSAAADTGDSDAPRTRQSVVYHHCPKCLETRVDTAEGPVRIDAARVDELKPFADQVTIDPDETLEAAPHSSDERDAPNTAQLVRKVLHRDGMCCANPGCRSRHRLQSHHVIFRANGGRTILANEITVCSYCHALIHAGLLDVTGSTRTGSSSYGWIDLVWTPAVRRKHDTPRHPDERSDLRATTLESAAADSERNFP